MRSASSTKPSPEYFEVIYFGGLSILCIISTTLATPIELLKNPNIIESFGESPTNKQGGNEPSTTTQPPLKQQRQYPTIAPPITFNN